MPGASWKGPQTRAFLSKQAVRLSFGRVQEMSIRLRNARVEGVEQAHFVLVGIGTEVTVRLVDHLKRCSHSPREGEERDARGDREGRIRVPEVVGPAVLEAGCPKRGLPVALAKVVDVECAEHSPTEWHPAPRAVCLRVLLELPVRVDALNADDSPLPSMSRRSRAIHSSGLRPVPAANSGIAR